MKNKKIIFILIALIFSAALFFLTQTNRVYIKAVVKKDCTVTVNYKDYFNNEKTVYKRAYKYSDDVEKIKVRLKDNVKSMEIEVENNDLNIESISIISWILPYKVKSLPLNDNIFTHILLIRILFSLILGFAITLILWKLTEIIYKRKEKFMIFTFIFIFVFPLLLLPVPLEKIDIFNIQGEKTIFQFPNFSIKSFVDKSYQQQFEGWFNQHLTWNALYIRLFNTTYYTLFEKSYSSNSELIIGKNKYLYEKSYIDTLFEPNHFEANKDNIDLQKIDTKMEQRVTELKEIQDYIESKGKVFVFVITPSKAIFEKNNIPDRFGVEENTYQTQTHDLFVKKLTAHKIKFADTPQYIETHMKDEPVFSKGGVHWNDYGKVLGTNALIEELNKSSKYDFDSLKIQKKFKNRFPQNEDQDLISLLNIFGVPKYFTVEQLIIEPTTKNNNLKVKAVGDSFLSGICDFLGFSHTFKNIDYYFYINKKIISYTDYVKKEVRTDDSVKDISKNIKESLTGDIIILEINDTMIDQENGHINAYIQEMKKIISEDRK